MKIRIYPDRILRQPAGRASEGEAERLAPKLIAAMISYSGIGIAAPQVGLGIQLAVVSETADENLKKPLVLINPRITEASGTQVMEEGCLSIKGVTARVRRNETVTVETGPDSSRQVIEAGGLLAVVIQHEVDHLNGVLFPDRLGLSGKCWSLYKARIKKKSGR